MKTESATKTRLLFLGIVVLLVLTNLMIIFWHFLPGKPRDWKDNTFAGRVVHIDETSFTTADPRNENKIFRFDEQTVFTAGRDVVSRQELVVGKPVLVITSSATSTVAREVRIMSGKPKDKQVSL